MFCCQKQSPSEVVSEKKPTLKRGQFSSPGKIHQNPQQEGEPTDEFVFKKLLKKKIVENNKALINFRAKLDNIQVPNELFSIKEPNIRFQSIENNLDRQGLLGGNKSTLQVIIEQFPYAYNLAAESILQQKQMVACISEWVKHLNCITKNQPSHSDPQMLMSQLARLFGGLQQLFKDLARDMEKSVRKSRILESEHGDESERLEKYQRFIENEKSKNQKLKQENRKLEDKLEESASRMIELELKEDHQLSKMKDMHEKIKVLSSQVQELSIKSSVSTQLRSEINIYSNQGPFAIQQTQKSIREFRIEQERYQKISRQLTKTFAKSKSKSPEFKNNKLSLATDK